MSDDFCVSHGYETMKSQYGNPIPYCEACERDRDYDKMLTAWAESRVLLSTERKRSDKLEAGLREAFRVGWYTNSAVDDHTPKYLRECEEADWKMYASSLSMASS